MPARSLAPRLANILEAIERGRGIAGNMSFDAFEANWEKRWLVERGVEIISEASRRLTDELKAGIPIFRGAGLPALATCCAIATKTSQPP